MSTVFRIIRWVENTALWILIGLLYYFSMPLESKKNIHLDPGSAGSIISQLSQKGYDVGLVDRWTIMGLGQPLGGWIYLGKKRIDRLDFLSKLVSRRSHFSPVTLIPGETTIVFLDHLAKTLDLNVSKLESSYRQLSLFPEAGILADTYHVPLHLRERGVMQMLIRLSLTRYQALSKEHLGNWDPKGWQKTLTVASIIQKEAANRQEMPKISSVIYNRITRHMRLQMDGTLNYGRYSHARVTPQRIKTDRSTFNTYKHKGLPASPVCNVSLSSIRAALNPASTTYLYFMKNDRGTHDFSRTYKGHLKNVKERKREVAGSR